MSNENESKSPSKKTQMKQPFKLLVDILGVITSLDFFNDMNKYIKDNIKDYLNSQWKSYNTQQFINKLRKQTDDDKKANTDLPSIVASNDGTNQEIIESVIDNINWRETNNLDTFSETTEKFFGDIWTEIFSTKKLTANVFDDVVPAFKNWTSNEYKIKIFTIASISRHKQKAFLKSTTAGDLNKYIETRIKSKGDKYDSNQFKYILSSLLVKYPQNVLYLTGDPVKGRAAIEAKLRVVVVIREGSKSYSEEQLSGLEVIKSLEELDFLLEYE